MAKNGRKKTYCENNKKPLPPKPNSRLEQYLDYMIRNGQYAELTKENDGATHYVVVNGQWVPAGDDYMCYICEEDAKIMVSVFGEVPFPNLSYSFDKVAWHHFIDETSYVNVEAGQEIYFKGVNERTSELYIDGDYEEWYIGWQIVPYDENDDIVNFSVYGNPASILFGADVSGVQLADGALADFFSELPIVSIEKMPKCKLSKHCYDNMFHDCMSLATAPELHATELTDGCYCGMFGGCASLTEAPELPATKLAESCYEFMFEGCTSLTEAPELPATKLAVKCYNNMFNYCTSLLEAPELPATELYYYCYSNMFSGCTSLYKISVKFTDFEDNATNNWLYGVQDNGIFVCPESLAEKFIDGTHSKDADTIPYSWKIVPITDNPLCFALDGEDWADIYVRPNNPDAEGSYYIEFSFDKKYWEVLNDSIYLYTDYPEVYVRGVMIDEHFAFDGTAKIKATGSMKSINYESNVYSNMFYGCTSLTEAPELPATVLSDSCYSYMFYECTSLATVPELPATELASNCYSNMFHGCTSLTEAPELPATELAQRCYSNMFRNCTSLTEAPELPATELANYCYSGMFYGCTSLTEAPELPATELADWCYFVMFGECASLTEAPELPATVLASNCYNNMFVHCTSLIKVSVKFTDFGNGTSNWFIDVSEIGTFYCPEALTISERGSSTVPSGWTVERITA